MIDENLKMCMTARYHKGDENGTSNAKFRAVYLGSDAIAAGYEEAYIEYTRTIELQESGKNSDGSSFLKCDYYPAEVIIGRLHTGDENGLTTYTLGKIVAVKRLRDGTLVQMDCCAIDNPDNPSATVKVISGKESSSNWVENSGMPIVARRHSGDENGNTQTYFSDIYIFEKGVAKFKLEFSDEIVLGSQKESSSNFKAEAVKYNDSFNLWCAPAFDIKFLDHTWVEALENSVYKDEFCCQGGTGKHYFHSEFGIPQGAISKMQRLRGNNDSIDIIYILDGVCHQMANRFLIPSGSTISLNLSDGIRPHGYVFSTLVYGCWGRRFKKWLKKYMDGVNDESTLMKKGTLAYEMLKVHQDETLLDDASILVKESEVLLNNLLPGFGENVFAAAQKKLKEDSEKIFSSVISTNSNGEFSLLPNANKQSLNSAFSQINELQLQFQQFIKGELGNNDFKNINNGDATLYELINVDSAVEFYLPKK